MRTASRKLPNRASSSALQRRPRVDSTSGDWYDTSGHLVWVGDRTRQPDHAHVEFLRGVKNPIAIKCGPSLSADGLQKLLDILDPEREPGRTTLICRFGVGKVEAHLPALIRAGCADWAGAALLVLAFVVVPLVWWPTPGSVPARPSSSTACSP